MNRADGLVLAPVLGSLLLIFSAPLPTQAAERDIAQIGFAGLETVSAESIHRKLANLPEIYEATHPVLDHSTYVHRVREAVARGMLASGFFDSHVEVIESDPLALRIKEGPRFRRGEVTVGGASEAVCDWVRSQLLIASTAKEDAKPVWVPGKPANGSLFAGMRQRHAIQQRLIELGLDGSDASIDVVRNDQNKSQDVQIELAPTDASFQVPTKSTSVKTTTETKTDDSASENLDAPKGLAAELHQIHQRLFSEPTAGVRFRGSGEELTMDLFFGQRVAVADIVYQSHRRKIVLADGELLISMDDPQAAIRLPIPNASAVVYQQSSEESKDGKTMGITINGAFSSDKPSDPIQMGARFTAGGWDEWFPPEFTERTEDETSVRFSFQDHRLVLDSEGQLIELTGTDLEGRRLSITPVSEEEIDRVAEAITATAQPIELFVHDPETDRRVVLREIFQAFADDESNDDEFHIPPAGGEKDIFGVLILMVVNDGKVVDADSLLGRLSKLYALEISGNRRTLSERVFDIELELLQGPITSAVLADLLARKGNLERALRYYRHSQSITGDVESVQNDVRVLIDPTNLLGRLCEQVDMKQWLEQTTQLAAPFVEESQVALVQGVVALMPDATNEQERLENARRLTTLAYELQGRAMLQQHISIRIQALQAHQKRLAEKEAKSKEKKR